MRYIGISPSMLLAAAVTLALATHSFAYDDLGVPPPDPAGTVQVPLTNATVQKELDQRLADRFQSVVGSSPRLTEQQAKDASWGFVSDHFAEIDREKKGYVTRRGYRSLQGCPFTYADAKTCATRRDRQIGPAKTGRRGAGRLAVQRCC